jgi:hypothetical protein
MKVLDPSLYAKLEKIDCLNMFCSFRWILVLFRREFSFSDTQILWDALFTNYYTSEMHVFVSLAIFEINRSAILFSVDGEDDLIKLTHSLAGKLNVSQVLVESEELYLRLKKRVLLDGLPDKLTVSEIVDCYIK